MTLHIYRKNNTERQTRTYTLHTFSIYSTSFSGKSNNFLYWRPRSHCKHIHYRYIYYVLYKRICEIALFYSFTVCKVSNNFSIVLFTVKYMYIVLVLLTLPILRSFNPCHYPPACFVCFYLIYVQNSYTCICKRNKVPKRN